MLPRSVIGRGFLMPWAVRVHSRVSCQPPRQMRLGAPPDAPGGQEANMSETNPLDVLREAVQEFANSRTEVPKLVDHALLLWEAVSFDDDGEAYRSVHYAVPTG